MDIAQLVSACDGKSPDDILFIALNEFENIAISFSGAEDVVLIDMAVKINPNIKIFSLETGRLHPETYKFMDQIRKYYNIQIDFILPDHEQLQTFVCEKGLYSFYQDGHQACCEIRKVAPLRRKLLTCAAWITGQRQDQSPDTRQGISVVEQDDAFSTVDRKLVKFNPLCFWTSKRVWQYIHENKVPFNALHEKGFVSIGCEPCTRPILPGQHEREGRWWWEEATKKECGLHFQKNNE